LFEELDFGYKNGEIFIKKTRISDSYLNANTWSWGSETQAWPCYPL